MSIHNQACSSDCQDDDCPGIHPSTLPDWPLFVVIFAFVIFCITIEVMT